MKNVLLVDDSATILLSMRQTLEMSNFKVTTASDGMDGLAKLKSQPKPDVIVTDINMPRLDGIGFIREARQLPNFRFTPILVLTTESQQAKRDEAKRLGATGWLVKPVAAADLVRVLKQVLPGA
jgi:two-component system chemotaxis response regulator CheY